MSSSPIRVRSEIAADMAEDIAELKRLKQLQARIFGQLRSDEQQREADQRQQDRESLTRLTRLLVELVQKLRAERDALAAELADQNRVVELRRMADEIMAFAAARREEEAPIETAAAPPQQLPLSSLSQPPRRALGAASRPAPRPVNNYSARNERAAWTFRS